MNSSQVVCARALAVFAIWGLGVLETLGGAFRESSAYHTCSMPRENIVELA